MQLSPKNLSALVLASAAAVLAFTSAAQTAPHAPAVPFAAPPQTPYGVSISIESAKSAAAAAVVEAKKNKLNMAIAIVDTGGYLVYFEKMQDTQTGSVQLAIEKAQTSALFRRPSKVFQDGVAAGGEGLRLLRLTGTIPIEGGLPIIQDGKIVGAIGISGGSGAQDQQVAVAGAAAK
jgi:glc operon protein GlcG